MGSSLTGAHKCPHSAHPHQELWAVDQLQVQEFMLSFLRDPLREIEEPYFFLDEVSPTSHPLSETMGGLTRTPSAFQEPDLPSGCHLVPPDTHTAYLAHPG